MRRYLATSFSDEIHVVKSIYCLAEGPVIPRKNRATRCPYLSPHDAPCEIPFKMANVSIHGTTFCLPKVPLPNAAVLPATAPADASEAGAVRGTTGR